LIARHLAPTMKRININASSCPKPILTEMIRRSFPSASERPSDIKAFLSMIAHSPEHVHAVAGLTFVPVPIVKALAFLFRTPALSSRDLPFPWPSIFRVSFKHLLYVFPTQHWRYNQFL